MPQRPASADWHGQIIRYPRQTLVGPGQWHEGPEPLHTAGAGFYLWWRHEEAPVRFQRPRPPRWALIGPFPARAAAVRHRKAMAAAGGAGRSTGRMTPVQDQGAKQWTAAQARRFGRGYGSSIYAAEARGDDREAGRLLDEFEARDAALPPALSRIFVEAYQAARWKRLPKGRRSLQEDLAALPVGSVVVQAGAPPHLREPLLKLTDVAFVPWRNGRLDASVKFAADPGMLKGLGAFAPFPYKRVEVVYRGADGVAWLRAQAGGQRVHGRRAPAAMRGLRAPAAMRIGKTIYEILDTTRVQTPRSGNVTRWKLRSPDGKEHKLERIDGRGQPYYKSSRWSRPHLIAAEEVRYLPAIAGDRPKPARPPREPVAQGIQTHIVSQSAGEGGQHLVTVSPGAWVRLHGTREVSPWTRGVGYGKPVLKPYDLTFKLGDTAVNGSYNLTYTGVIESIGPKRILVVGVPVGRKSMDLRAFSFYNRDFDAERIARENADTRMRI